MLPVWIAATIVVVALAVHLSGTTQRKPKTRGPERDPSLTRWAEHVRNQLPRAFDALQVTAAGPLRNNRRPPIRVHGVGKPSGVGGWEWPIELPGAAIDDDIDERRLASAINQGHILVDVCEVRSQAAGWSTVAAWRTDPLKLSNTIPYQPGSLPAGKWGDRWSLGRKRDGTEVLLPLWMEGGGAFHHLFGGSTGSGKTRWMLTGIAHAMQLGAEIYLVDLVKGVDDRDWLPIHGGLTEAWEDPKLAVKGLEHLLEDTLSRPRWHPSDGTPFRLVVIDEMQALIASKGGGEILTRLVSEIRSKGGAVFGATQLPETTEIKAAARTNFRIKMAGRLDNEAEYKAALGGKWSGTKIPDDPDHWGVGYADLDGRGAQRFRGWLLSDGWLAEHTRRVAAVRA